MVHPIRRTIALVVLLSALIVHEPAQAEQGEPVAIRLWPSNGVTIETMWDLHLGVRINESNQDELPRQCDAILNPSDKAIALDREPNAFQPGVHNLQDKSTLSPNAIKAFHIATADTSAPGHLVFIEVDGVRILDASQTVLSALPALLESAPQLAQRIQGVDALLAPASATPDELLAISTAMSPRIVILSPSSSFTQVGDAAVTPIDHNTIAVSARRESATTTRWVRPTTRPWALDDNLANLFAKKEAACKASQDLFATLSVNQMNFDPGNGTHTPRWNVEHMMGTELNFFSSIYTAKDPEIPTMNPRPAQMPRQYQAAHPDWSGAEEARQMQRVQAYSRRFAYLLNTKPTSPANAQPTRRNRLFQNPKQLLNLMANHYGEHTAHVPKKMALPNWPSN